MIACRGLASEVGTAAACLSLDVPRATFYRRIRASAEVLIRPRPTPERALSLGERQAVLEALHSDRFADRAPAEVYATLLDEGTYLCSIRTMYRVLADASEVRERRNQLRHPHYQAPQLLATAPKPMMVRHLPPAKLL